MLRAVVDTNVWTSAIISPTGRAAAVYEALLADRFVLVISDYLAEELADVLSRPKVVRKHHRNPGRAEEVAEALRRVGEVVEVRGEVRLCRDRDDDAVIETALKGDADVLVTRDDDLKGDRDLVRALEEAGVRVVTVTRFLEEIEREAMVGEAVDEAGGQ